MHKNESVNKQNGLCHTALSVKQDVSTIEALYKKFTDGMAMCEMNLRLSKKIIQNQQKQIRNDYKKLFDEKKLDIPILIDCMSFYRWHDKNYKPIESYGKIEATLNSLWNEVIRYHNKLYQWQLATAYEYYEKFLEGIVKIVDPETKNISNFHTKIIKRYPEYKELLVETRIKQKIDIKESQKNPSGGLISGKTRYDPMDYDHEFSISLIEQFRHVIVHNNGIMGNKKNILKKTGKNGRVYELVLNAYLNKENEIQLLEIPILIGEDITIETDVIKNIFTILLNSAYYIYREIGKIQTNSHEI